MNEPFALLFGFFHRYLRPGIVKASPAAGLAAQLAGKKRQDFVSLCINTIERNLEFGMHEQTDLVEL